MIDFSYFPEKVESGGLCLTRPRKTGFQIEVDTLDTHSQRVVVDPVLVIRAGQENSDG